MADNKRDITGVPLEDLSAEEAALASEEMMAKISELIAQMQQSEMRRSALAREANDIQSASGFKGYLARLLNEKASANEVRKQQDLGMSIREMKKMQAMMLHKSIVEFRSNPDKETEDEAKARYADLELKALRSLGDLYREGIVDKNAYAKLFSDIDEQSNRVYRGGAQNLEASRNKREEDKREEKKAREDEAAKSSIHNRVYDFSSSLRNSKFGKSVTGFVKTATPFYKNNKVAFSKIFNGQLGGRGAAKALEGLGERFFGPIGGEIGRILGKPLEWAGDYNDDRAQLRQKGIAGGFGIGALGTEKARQYEDIGESLNKGGGKAFVSFAANVNNMLEQMRRGGDGGQLAAANQRYGLVLNGSGEGGLAKDADEIIRNIISRVSTYQKSGNVQAVAGLLRTLGVDEKNMELFMHGQEAYDTRVSRKSKMYDSKRAQELDESAMKTVEAEQDTARTMRNAKEVIAGKVNWANRAYHGTVRAVTQLVADSDRENIEDTGWSNYLATDENAAERKKAQIDDFQRRFPGIKVIDGKTVRPSKKKASDNNRTNVVVEDAVPKVERGYARKVADGGETVVPVAVADDGETKVSRVGKNGQRSGQNEAKGKEPWRMIDEESKQAYDRGEWDVEKWKQWKLYHRHSNDAESIRAYRDYLKRQNEQGNISSVDKSIRSNVALENTANGLQTKGIGVKDTDLTKNALPSFVYDYLLHTPDNITSRIIPETVGGGTSIGSQNNNLSVKVDKVELHTTSSTLDGAGQDVGVGIKEGLESWSKPLIKNFGDTEL